MIDDQHRTASEPVRVPVVLVTGLDADVMASTTIAWQWDLPDAVVLRHELDVEQGRLRRVVSDGAGVVEDVVHVLEHACTSCALRQDIVPTLERLAADGRWRVVVAHLPVAVPALPVCRMVERYREIAPHVRVSAVVAALAGPSCRADLTTDDLLVERGLHRAEDDDRGVAEVAAALVEHADVVVTVGDCDPIDSRLLATLARPGAQVVEGPHRLAAAQLVEARRDDRAVSAWLDPVTGATPLPADGEGVWTLELSSARPFHPERLRDRVAELASGPFRTRGCFWLPTRPGRVAVWDGAAGQLAIGPGPRCTGRRPATRIVVTGLSEHDERDRLRQLFDEVLLDDEEVAERGMYWEAGSDGLEPWLGAINRAA